MSGGDPIEVYFARELIGGRAYEAAKRLREDVERASGSELRGVKLDGMPRGGSLRPHGAPSGLEAKRRVAEALAGLPARQRQLVQLVVCEEKFANEAAVAARIKPRKGIDQLRDALEALGNFYFEPRPGRRARPSNSGRNRR